MFDRIGDYIKNIIMIYVHDLWGILEEGRLSVDEDRFGVYLAQTYHEMTSQFEKFADWKQILCPEGEDNLLNEPLFPILVYFTGGRGGSHCSSL